MIKVLEQVGFFPHTCVWELTLACNLRCKYCFYLEKTSLHPLGEQYRMSDAVLDSYIRQHIAAQPGDWTLVAPR